MTSTLGQLGRRLATCLLAILALQACGATPPEPATTSEPTALAFIGGRVYTAPDAPPIDDSVVLVQSGRITAVGSRATTSVQPGTATIDCTGLVVTAGFQNSHVHFTPPGWTTPSSAPAREVVSQLQALETFNPADEYAFMAKAGIGYREVLASLTTSPAQWFREETRRGRVAPGLEADLVVLGADPALDPRAFADVRYTVRDGRIIYDRTKRAN